MASKEGSVNSTIVPLRQSLIVNGWHPRTSVNGNNARRHWSVIRKNHDIDRDMAWASAMQAGWVFIPGKVRLTITLVYPRKYRVDYDGLVSRCKGLIDGLRNHPSPWVKDRPGYAPGPLGFFEDDDTEHLDLVVRAEVVPRQKAIRIELEPVTE